MKFKQQAIGMLLVISVGVSTRTYAQTTEIENLFRDSETRAAAGTPGTVDEADSVLERFTQGTRENVARALPVILHAASDSHVSVRRLAGLALYGIANRPDGPALLSTETATFAALLIDPDIPIRRVTGLAIGNLHLNASSPLMPILETYLGRQDAVSTTGAGVAGLLMEAAPNDAVSTNAVVQFMRRDDQTSASRGDLLIAISVAKSRSREIGKEVAGYADDPDEQTSIHAIETLQAMGKSAILDNQQSLSRIAADTNRTPGTRVAAAKALSAIQ